MFDKQEQRWWREVRGGSDEGGERRSSSSMQGMRNWAGSCCDEPETTHGA